MATGGDVLAMICPEKEWVVYGNDYDSIQWIKGEPISKADFEAGFAKYDSWKAEQDAQAVTDKAKATAKLEALGLTVVDLAALGL